MGLEQWPFLYEFLYFKHAEKGRNFATIECFSVSIGLQISSKVLAVKKGHVATNEHGTRHRSKHFELSPLA